jgi:DNA-binding Xre family transcriptional regulator
MARKFKELREKMSPESRARADKIAARLREEMPLYELREARRLTQEQMAEALGISQGNISRMERRTDLYLSTLRKFVEALGGELEIRARFPDGDVTIGRFGALENGATA